MKLSVGKPIDRTRLETRTKECRGHASLLECILKGATNVDINTLQPIPCDPIDGELYLDWMKSGEILMEVLSRSDVQFDGVIWV